MDNETLVEAKGNRRRMFKPTVVFWTLTGLSVFVASELFIPAVRDLFRGSFLFLVPLIVFSSLGGVLIFLTLRGKVQKPLKKFLLLTGVFSTGFFVSVFLHNAFYALGIITSQIAVLSYFMKVLHVAFFIIAIFVCPIGFLISVVGTIMLLIKERKGR